MAQVCAPVTIITTTVDGQPFGSTVSAFASLSVTPPMVVLALDNRGSLISKVQQTKRLGANVLASDQADVAAKFAARGRTDRFEDLDWAFDHGLPRLGGTSAWLRCDVVEFRPGGDHTLALATVHEAIASELPGLTYYQRSFGSATSPTQA